MAEIDIVIEAGGWEGFREAEAVVERAGLAALEHFQVKWMPVRVKKMRQDEERGHVFDFIESKRALVAEEAASDASLAVLLTDDATMRRLNATFRGKDKPTNVLSFPAARPPAGTPGAESLFLGDLALGYETCAAEAKAEGKALGDHLAHLVVHGILHLMGHDHETEAEAERMEGRERVILASLGIIDPYSGAKEAPLDE